MSIAFDILLGMVLSGWIAFIGKTIIDFQIHCEKIRINSAAAKREK